MRSLRSAFLATCVLAAACGGGGGDDGGDGDGSSVDAGPPPPAEGFRITSTPIRIEPGQEITYCFYTTINITRDMGVKRWSSTMTPGSHHLILFFTSGTSKPDGTIDQCGGGGLGGGGTSVPFWTYSAQTPTAEAVMPAGIGMTVPKGQKVYVQMHYLNLGDEPIMANVQIDGEAYKASEQYTAAAAYVTYRAGFTVGANTTGETGGTCDVPAGAKFFMMSTHAHKQATLTRVTDGTTVVFESRNWEHPGAAKWDSEPFFSFATNKLRYHCEYDNTGNPNAVPEGPSASTNEMCMAVGYFFPATTPKMCFNDFVIN